MTTLPKRGAGPRTLATLTAALCGIAGVGAVGATPAAAADHRQAVYAIAHRVDTVAGVDAATWSATG
ncbi:hypothetical protein [Kitasatospora sp. NPDC086791]|uniref:hypothetical protein n=1 Tax=Kitasatospora sp. NPDC086791 TaxID=3155178 RepID=UPI00342A46E7